VHLGVVAAGFGVLVEGAGVAELGGLVVPLHHRELGVVEELGRVLDSPRRDRQEEVADDQVGGRGAADELAHDAGRACCCYHPVLGLHVAGDEAEQGGLARSVRADEGGGDPLADLEAGVVEQRPPVRQHVADVRHLDMPHPPDAIRARRG
jgi:hypothetical protein